MSEEEGSTGTVISVIMSVVIMFVVGVVGFYLLVPAVSGPEASASTNCSVAAGGTVFNIGGLVLIIGAMVAIIGLLMRWVSTPERFKEPGKIYKFLATSFMYFGYGLLSIVIVGIPSYLVWLSYSYIVVDGHTGAFLGVLKIVGMLVGAYLGIAGIGWLSKRYFYDKLSERLKERDYEKNMKELPGAVE